MTEHYQLNFQTVFTLVSCHSFSHSSTLSVLCRGVQLHIAEVCLDVGYAKYKVICKCLSFIYVGHLVPTGYSLTGRGGSVVVNIACLGCNVQVEFNSSSMSATDSRRNVVSYALLLLPLVLASPATTSSLVGILECLRQPTRCSTE